MFKAGEGRPALIKDTRHFEALWSRTPGKYLQGLVIVAAAGPE
ncbi:MAG TPA: hypothetical protein VF591_07095 [Pyrinomonadaceae bacterium]